MSICSVNNCRDTGNIWKISNDNTNPPFFQEFSLCNTHLHIDKRFEMIHKALVRGRFNNQSGDKISTDGWKLEKVITTWERNDQSYIKCSFCNTGDKIWIIIKPVQAKESDDESNPSEVEDEDNVKIKTDLLCDEHIARFGVSDDLKIRSHNDNIGSSTLESTWVEKKLPCATPPKKARKDK